MSRRLRLLPVLPLLLAFAPAPKPKDDAKAFEGAWEVVRMECDGLVEPRTWGAKAVIKGELLTARGCGRLFGDADLMGFTLDPKKKRPQEVTLNAAGRFAADGSVLYFVGATIFLEGICKLEKDTLTICFSCDGRAARPKEFATKPGSGHALLVLRRVKP